MVSRELAGGRVSCIFGTVGVLGRWSMARKNVRAMAIVVRDLAL